MFQATAKTLPLVWKTAVLQFFCHSLPRTKKFRTFAASKTEKQVENPCKILIVKQLYRDGG